MKIKEMEVKKNLPAAELQNELAQLREKRFRLGFKHRVTPLSNPLELREIRRDIARIKTWIRAREIQGVAK